LEGKETMRGVARRQSRVAGELDAPLAPCQLRRRRWDRFFCACCLLSVTFLVSRDLSLPHVRDVEVWLGIEVRGEWARWSAPLHWLWFAVAAYGFGSGRRWPWRVAPVYLAYVAVSHFIWNLTSPNGGGLVDASVQLFAFLAMGAVLWGLDRKVCGQVEEAVPSQAVGGASASTVHRRTTRRRG
jgi:hypothetical protein